MKLKTLLLLLLLSGLFPVARGQRTPVRRPAYACALSGMFSPRLVQTQGDSTSVSFVVQNAFSYSLSSRSRLVAPDGKHYPLRHARLYSRDKDGRTVGPCEVVLDGEIWLYADEQRSVRRDSVVMVFDALPSNVRTFDYEEAFEDARNMASSFNIYGIRLDGKAYPKLKHKKAAYSKAPLPELRPAWQKARLRVRLEGELPDRFPPLSPSLFFWGGDTLGCSQAFRVVPGRDAKEQIVEVDCCEPLTVSCSILGQEFVPLFVPGEELTAVVDVEALMRRREGASAKATGETVRFEGEYADLSAVMTYYIENVSKMKLLVALTQRVFKTRRLPTLADYREGLYETLCNWRRDIDADRRLTPRQKEFLHLYAEDCYVNGVLLYRSNMKSFQQICNADSAALAAFDEDLRLADSQPDPHFAELRLFAQPGSLRPLIVYPTRTDWYDYLRLNRVASGRLFDWAREKKETLAAMDSIDQLRVLTETELSALPARYAPTVRQANERLKVTLAEVERVKDKAVPEVPAVKPGQSLLQAIVDTYRGQVVVVDIWDTWCGPCRMGMEGLRPLKEELKGQDVVFVYICDESSPLSEWVRLLPEIGGFHYRLTAEQQGRLQLASRSIPHYFIFNKEGELTFDVLGYSHQLPDAIREEINKILHP